MVTNKKMATKQDGLRYLKNRTATKIADVEKNYSNEITKVNKEIESVKDKIAKELKVDSEHMVTIKLKNGIVKLRFDKYYLKSNELDKLKAKADKCSYKAKQDEINNVKAKAMEIEQQVLLHGMSDEIKKLLAGF